MTPVQQSNKRKATSPPTDEPRDLRKHGHNQYTPKEELVKYGAPSLAKGRERYRARINTFLRRSPTPPWAKDRSKLYGGVGEQARAFTASMALQDATGASMALQGIADTATSTPRYDNHESMWVEHADEMPTTTPPPNITQPSAVEKTFANKTAPIELVDDTTSDGSPDTRVMHDGWGAQPDDLVADNATEKPRRKLAQPMNFMERMAAEEAANAETNTSPKSREQNQVMDSGSYASQLEQELVKANARIDELSSAFDEAQGRILQFEAEITTMREGFTAARGNAVA